LELRLKEVQKLGLKKCFIPFNPKYLFSSEPNKPVAANKLFPSLSSQLTLIPSKGLADVLSHLPLPQYRNERRRKGTHSTSPKPTSQPTLQEMMDGMDVSAAEIGVADEVPLQLETPTERERML
jgi:hypothetical protein